MPTPLSLDAEITTYLQSQALPVGLNFNGAGTINLFASTLPDSPDTAVGVHLTGGMLPVMTLTGLSATESAIDRSTFQIVVRVAPNQYTTGNALIQGIYKSLQGITETRINGGTNTLFHLITALQPPVYLGRGENVDKRQRHVWSQNYLAWIDDPFR